MAAKKTSTKAPAKKSPAAKKATPKKATRSSRKTTSRKSGGKLHSVARSIGATLGSIAKKTSRAVEAAKQAIPNPLHHDNSSDEQSKADCSGAQSGDL